MSGAPRPVRVIHFVGPDTPANRVALLSGLLGQADAADAHAVFACGRGWTNRAHLLALAPRRRLHLQIGFHWLLADELASATIAFGPTAVHFWSAEALEACLLGRAGRCLRTVVGPAIPICIDGDLTQPESLWTCIARADRAGVPASIVCPTRGSLRRAARAGVPTSSCVELRESPDLPTQAARAGRTRRAHDQAACPARGRLSTDRAAVVRRRLRVPFDARIVLLAPPFGRGRDRILSLWAASLAQVVLPDLHVLAPEHDGGSLRHLVHSARLGARVRFLPPDLSLVPAASLASAALILPRGDIAGWGVDAVARAGVPLVASDVRCVREMVQDEKAVAWCRANDPRDAARALLELLEDAGAADRFAARMGQAGQRLPSAADTCAAYRRLWSPAAHMRGTEADGSGTCGGPAVKESLPCSSGSAPP